MPEYKKTITPSLEEIAKRAAIANTKQGRRQRVFIRAESQRFKRIVDAQTPVDTGKFKSKHVVSNRIGNRRGFSFSAMHPLSTYIRQGTEAHDITGNPYLVFMKGGKKWVVTKVNHPGTAKNNYVRRAVDQWLPTTKAGLVKLADDWIKDFSG